MTDNLTNASARLAADFEVDQKDARTLLDLTLLILSFQRGANGNGLPPAVCRGALVATGTILEDLYLERLGRAKVVSLFKECLTYWERRVQAGESQE
jgi:hypothetical protein